MRDIIITILVIIAATWFLYVTTMEAIEEMKSLQAINQITIKEE